METLKTNKNPLKKDQYKKGGLYFFAALILTVVAYSSLGNLKGLREYLALKKTSQEIVQCLQYHAIHDRDGIWEDLSSISKNMPNYPSTHEKLGDVYTHLKAYSFALKEYALADLAENPAFLSLPKRGGISSTYLERQIKCLNVLLLQSEGEVTPAMWNRLKTVLEEERLVGDQIAKRIPELENLLAIGSFQQNNYQEALMHWEQVIPYLTDADLIEQIKQLMAQAQFHLNESIVDSSYKPAIKVKFHGPTPHEGEMLYMAFSSLEEGELPYFVTKVPYLQEEAFIYLSAAHQMRPWPTHAEWILRVKIGSGSVDEGKVAKRFILPVPQKANGVYEVSYGE